MWNVGVELHFLASPKIVLTPNPFFQRYQQQESPEMYAIAFDMDTTALQQNYHVNSWQNAYAGIRSVLFNHGFITTQGSVYFGNNQSITSVQCVLAVQDLARQFPWFAASVRDIRMLRIEESNDLMPVIVSNLHSSAALTPASSPAAPSPAIGSNP